MTETDDVGPADVTLLTARAVEPGYEQDFREWFGRVTDTASAFPGHLGGRVVPACHGCRAMGSDAPVPRPGVRAALDGVT
ncbi:hypothetical protein [Streptomyces globisporus]